MGLYLKFTMFPKCLYEGRFPPIFRLEFETESFMTLHNIFMAPKHFGGGGGHSVLKKYTTKMVKETKRNIAK